jgi:hypothetical protein
MGRIPFVRFARRRENLVIGWLKDFTGRHPVPPVVGVREFCTDRRYVAFYSTPKLKVYTPPDGDEITPTMGSQ